MFSRADALPPYLLAEMDEAKRRLVRDGRDVIDLCLGSPDLPPPRSAVDALVASLGEPDASRYMPSPGIEALRETIARFYRRRYGVDVDPETEVVVTLGSKEGIAHLMLGLLDPGEVALVPAPSYPVHHFGVVIAGGEPAFYRVGPDANALDEIASARRTAPHARVLVVNYPHNPTATTVDDATLENIVRFARDQRLLVVSDMAYADLGFDGYRAPSVLAIPGANQFAVEFATLSKARSMAGWRVGFCVGNARMVGALRAMKRYLDYGMFKPIQRAAIAALDDDAYAATLADTYRARRDALCDALAAAGWQVPRPRATMFVWARLPNAVRTSSVAFARELLDATGVAVAPGATFGVAGEGFVRFGLVEPEDRLREAGRRVGAFLGRGHV